MRIQLSEEYEPFLRSYEEEGYAGLRVNTQKISVESFLGMTPFHLTPVPWTENGFYYQKDEPVTRHPHYFAGLYYIQEPSAMLPASLLPIEPGDMVLDLCAAPGGKATELSSRLQGEGLLVANDASASRAKALLKNLTVWGAANCCVTAETPQRLLESFGCFFDKILVDAPCSGEGMFRRDAGLIDSWMERGPKHYASLQRDILSCAAQMLKPGGYLVYSTCTFSWAEDEDVVEEILFRYPEMELCEIPMREGFAPGGTPCGKCIRLWPHRVKGEGHFAALLHKRTDVSKDACVVKRDIAGGRYGSSQTRCGRDTFGEEDTCRKNRKADMPGSDPVADMPPEVLDFLNSLPGQPRKNCRYAQIGEQCLFVPPYRLPKSLRYLRTGILVGTLKRGRFEPSQALAMLLDANSYPNILNLSSEDMRVTRYLKGETVDLEAGDPNVENGWVLVCADGFALGWGKCADGRIKNKYYPGWRMQA